MAKYGRFDPRNKKRNRHKNQYLERSSTVEVRRESGDEHWQLYDKYALREVVKHYK